MFFGGGTDWRDCRVIERAGLSGGRQIEGPLLVEEPTTTTLVFPGQILEVTSTGFLLITEKDSVAR